MFKINRSTIKQINSKLIDKISLVKHDDGIYILKIYCKYKTCEREFNGSVLYVDDVDKNNQLIQDTLNLEKELSLSKVIPNNYCRFELHEESISYYLYTSKSMLI